MVSLSSSCLPFVAPFVAMASLPDFSRVWGHVRRYATPFHFFSLPFLLYLLLLNQAFASSKGDCWVVTARQLGRRMSASKKTGRLTLYRACLVLVESSRIHQVGVLWSSEVISSDMLVKMISYNKCESDVLNTRLGELNVCLMSQSFNLIPRGNC